MKILFRLPFFVTLLITLLFSCSKNKGDSNDSSNVVLPDTLTTGWEKLSSLPSENFTDIFFTDNATGFAVGNSGIYKSTNGATDWTKINTTTNLFHIAAGNTNNACFVDGSFAVLVTQDGGSTFSNGTYPYPGGGAVGFFSCFFSDASTCYFSSNQYLWKSINGGTSIDTIYRFPNISPTNSLFFLNNLEGWVIRQDGIYQTTDGGDSWNKDTVLVNAYGSIQFLDSDNGYSSNYGTINKTIDGGSTWQPAYQFPFQVYVDIGFISINEGYCSLGNRVYKTTDAGSTWTMVVALGNEKINRIRFTDASHGWACTTDGVVLKFTQ